MPGIIVVLSQINLVTYNIRMIIRRKIFLPLNVINIGCVPNAAHEEDFSSLLYAIKRSIKASLELRK